MADDPGGRSTTNSLSYSSSEWLRGSTTASPMGSVTEAYKAGFLTTTCRCSVVSLNWGDSQLLATASRILR